MPSLSNLQVIFLGIIATELMLFFVLDGADFGAGMATFFVGDDLAKRQQIMKVTGPVWGGNETWAVTAFAVMFAAYPGWYSALTSGYYPLIFLMLFFLIFRGVAFDYRNQWHSRHYNQFWDWALFVGSLMPPFLLGIVFSSTVSGVPIRNGFVYAGMGDILTPFSLLGGILAVLLSLNVGLTRVIKKVKKDVAVQLTVALKRTTWALYLAVGVFVVLLPFNTRFFTNRPVIVPLLLLLLACVLVKRWNDGQLYLHDFPWRLSNLNRWPHTGDFSNSLKRHQRPGFVAVDGMVIRFHHHFNGRTTSDGLSFDQQILS